MRPVDDVVFSPKQAEPDSAELNLSEMGLTVVAADWGESGVEGNSIRTSTGQMLVDRHPKATTCVLKLAVREDTEVDLATAAYRLQQKVGEMQRSRRWMRRDFYFGNFAGSLLCLITGEVTLADIGGWQAGDSPDVTLTLVRNPTWYSTVEEESEEFKEETDRELIYTLPASKGTAEGLKSILVENLGSGDWRSLIWAEECEDYQEGPTAEIAYAASALTPRGGALVETEGGTKVLEAVLVDGWVTFLDSEILGVGHMTHRGPRRLWVRAQAPAVGSEEVQLKMRWRPLGAMRWSEDNKIYTFPTLDEYQWIDLGASRPQEAALGDQRWEFQILGRASGVSGGEVWVHRVCPLPTEQYVVLSVPEEIQGADAVTAITAPTTVKSEAGSGVAWTNPSNAKASDNTRATCKLPAGQPSNRLAAVGFGFSIPTGAAIVGVVATVERKTTGTGVLDRDVELMLAGVPSSNQYNDPNSWGVADEVITYGGPDDLWGLPLEPADVNHANFGLTLQTENTAGAERTAEVDAINLRIYYNESAGDARICFAERSVELASDGVFRQHPNDDVWASVVPDGFLPATTPGGLEECSSRGIVIPSQGDLEDLPDVGSNKLNARVKTRDGYHFAREAA